MPGTGRRRTSNRRDRRLPEVSDTGVEQGRHGGRPLHGIRRALNDTSCHVGVNRRVDPSFKVAVLVWGTVFREAQRQDGDPSERVVATAHRRDASDLSMTTVWKRPAELLEANALIITNVEAMVLDTGKDYPNPDEAGEAHGVRFISLIKIETDAGITGWSDIETQPHVGRAIVDVPSGGAVGFEGLKSALVGENRFER